MQAGTWLKVPFTMVLRVVCEKGVIEWIYRSEKGYKGREKNSSYYL